MPSLDTQSDMATPKPQTSIYAQTLPTKRNLFGRKKKSTPNLGSSASTHTLNSGGSASAGDSVESLDRVSGTIDSNDGALVSNSKIKNVFKRKSKPGLVSSDIIDEQSVDEFGESPKRNLTQGHYGTEMELQTDQSQFAPDTGMNTQDQRPSLSSRRRQSSSGPNRSTTLPLGTTAVSSWKENEYVGRVSTDLRPATSGGESGRDADDRGRLKNERVRAEAGAEVPLKLPLVPSVHVPHGLNDVEHRRRPTSRAPFIQTIVEPSSPDESASSTPATTITPPTPVEPQAAQFGATGSSANRLATQKRARASSVSNNQPSKLSQSMSSTTLTPSLEWQDSADTTGNTNNNNSNNPGGFFQNMFSVAQNAAGTISTAIPNFGNRSRSGTQDSKERDEDEASGAGTQSEHRTRTSMHNQTELQLQPQADTESSDPKLPEKVPAVKTLGQGELSLGSLGIATEDGDGSETLSSLRSYDFQIQRPLATPPDELKGQLAGATITTVPSGTLSATSAQGGSESALQTPASATRDRGLSVDTFSNKFQKTPLAEDSAFGDIISGHNTPDRPSSTVGLDDEDGNADRNRSNSVKSAERRSRYASSGNLLQSVPKPTGFAVASKKRNRDFHNLFKSVPEDDYLIEDYGCALQKEILLQGRFYISEGHICFYSNIFGWVNTLVISFDEVVSVEKKSTAMVFPNAIVIQTLHARYVFASFISRDATYELIVSIWNVGHPQLVQGPGEVHLDGAAPEDSAAGSNDDDGYDEGSDMGDSFTDAGDTSFEDAKDVSESRNTPSRTPSRQHIVTTGEMKEYTDNDFPGPHAHDPTKCGDEDQHFDKSLCDEVLPSPLGKVFTLAFGPNSYPFLQHFLEVDEKVVEISIPNNGSWFDNSDGKKSRTYQYTRPLAGGIGPKQTRCIITETIEINDLEDHVTIISSTQTPDVPSGGVFVVKTRYCLMWAEGNQTRIVSNFTIVWSGRSLLKGPIEKGASDGQISSNKSLLASLRRELAPKKSVSGARSGKAGRKRRKNVHRNIATHGSEAVAIPPTQHIDKSSDGIYSFISPVVTILSTIWELFSPILGGTIGVMLVTMLLTIFVTFWLRPGATADGHHAGYLGNVWMSEEERLWQWLGDRAGLEDGQLRIARGMGYEKAVSMKLGPVSESMSERQVENAINVMEEKLAALKRVMEKDRAEK